MSNSHTSPLPSTPQAQAQVHKSPTTSSPSLPSSSANANAKAKAKANNNIKSALALSRLPPPFSTSSTLSTTSSQSPSSSSSLTFIAQGAEGIVFKTHFLTPANPCMLKYRPPKTYRHPTLDRRLTRARILAEARVLVKGRKEGLDVPGLYGLDADAGWIITEWIPGPTIRNFLDAHQELTVTSSSTSDEIESNNKEILHNLMHRIGQTIGRMHAAGIVHGDLTTSNMMLRDESDESDDGNQDQQEQQEQQKQQHQIPSTPATSALSSIVLIDFGLASQTTQEEDRAVDLYVLERAFGATHPHAEPLFGDVVLDAYAKSYKGASRVAKRLADVRARGRKKSMVG